jgi:hypothetical protein
MTEERLPGPSVGSDLPFELPPCLNVSSHALICAVRIAILIIIISYMRRVWPYIFPMPDERCGFFSRWRSCCDNIFGVSRLAFQAPL